MRRWIKELVVVALQLPALLARSAAGGAWRCFCLAWARAHLGRNAVPVENQILGLIDFEGTRRIRLGKDCRIYKRVRLETRDDGEIIIGDGVVLSPGTVIVAHERVVVGPYAMIGEYTSVRDQDHRSGSSTHLRDAGFVTKPVAIGADAWIGRGCVILKGVNIGERAVVGANSVVTRDVPAFAIVAGSPARLLRYRDSSAARMPESTG